MTDHISPDGRWRWDGQRWVPNMSKPAPSLPPKQRRMSTGGILAIVAASTIAFLAFVTMVVALSSPGSKSNSTAKATTSPAATAAPQTKPTPAATAAPAPACEQPCAVANGVTVTASDLHYGVSSGNPYINPEAGNVYVTMLISATSQSNSEANLNPFDFVLRDGAGVKHRTSFSVSDSCPTWQAVNLTKGSTIANKCLLFEATADKPAGITLVWTPRLFGGDHDIKLS